MTPGLPGRYFYHYTRGFSTSLSYIDGFDRQTFMQKCISIPVVYVWVQKLVHVFLKFKGKKKIFCGGLVFKRCINEKKHFPLVADMIFSSDWLIFDGFWL